MVFKVCYQQAENQKDRKRMDKIEVFIDELQEEINNLINSKRSICCALFVSILCFELSNHAFLA